MKNVSKLCYTLLSFRGFLQFFYLEKEYIADTINFRLRSLRLVVEKPTNPKPNP